VRVLVAKDGISTGWDCPRAEVLVSFRPATDHTHMTQLLGRMVRNPLARRVPGDERLNSVDCILPFFDRTTAGYVVKFLTGQIDEIPGAGKKVLMDGRPLDRNPAIAPEVWACWDALPTLTLPQKGARPVKRLVALAQALSADGVRPGALKEVEDQMHAVLDEFGARYDQLLKQAVAEVWAVRGQAIRGRVDSAELTYSDFAERADDRAIRVAFEDAKKAFGADIAQSYVNHLAGPEDSDANDDGLRDAYVKASALATVCEIRQKVDQEADGAASSWFAEHRDAIRALPDDRQQEYEAIRSLATDRQRGALVRPRSRLEDYKILADDGQISEAPLVPLHLMSGLDGMFPIGGLNDWERQVVKTELARPGAAGWYRNPPRAAVDSLGVTYRDSAGNWRSMHPDFIFFHEVGGVVRASIVDPLEDSLVKLKGLARFAEDYGPEFHRVEAVAKVGTAMRLLDLQSDATRHAVLAAHGAIVDLYASSAAAAYHVE
jgi:hypothetical protein